MSNSIIISSVLITFLLRGHFIIVLLQEVCIDFACVNNYIKAEKNLLSLMQSLVSTTGNE